MACTARQAFARGVLANWLVCVAVWQAGAASSLPGKFLGAWLPVSAFVAMGLEHSARRRPSSLTENGFCPGRLDPCARSGPWPRARLATSAAWPRDRPPHIACAAKL